MGSKITTLPQRVVYERSNLKAALANLKFDLFKIFYRWCNVFLRAVFVKYNNLSMLCKTLLLIKIKCRIKKIEKRKIKKILQFLLQFLCYEVKLQFFIKNLFHGLKKIWWECAKYVKKKKKIFTTAILCFVLRSNFF